MTKCCGIKWGPEVKRCLHCGKPTKTKVKSRE